MIIKIATATEADKLLKNARFQEEWQALYGQCPWATSFQSIGFVMTWYEVYRDRFTPVVVSGFSPDGTLIGFLPLAIALDTRQLCVAGAHQAEYHAWLADPQYGNGFIEHAIEKLHQNFPDQTLIFRYLPPSTPVAWLNPEHPQGQCCMLEMHERPLMMVGDGSDLAASLRKKSNKSRLNRLKRCGEMRFEHIADAAELLPIFDEIINYYDFRQGAIHHSYPFQDDPLKKPFHIALMEIPNLCHVTVLKVGDDIVAAHFGVCSQHEVHLGIFAQNPFFAKHSPGKFHLLMLGQELAQHHFSTLDLTPGGDPWKERFATDHDKTYLLTVFPNRRKLIQRQMNHHLVHLAKQTLQKVGISPQAVRTAITRAQAAEKLLQEFRHPSELRLYRVSSENVPQLEPTQRMSRDKIEELLVFQPAARRPTRENVMSLALKRIEHEHHVYTSVEHEQLLYYAWLATPRETFFFPEVAQEFQFPPGSALLFDFYMQPQVQEGEFHQTALRQMFHDAIAISGITQVYIAVSSDNQLLRQTVEEMGCTYESSLFKARSSEKLKQGTSEQASEGKS